MIFVYLTWIFGAICAITLFSALYFSELKRERTSTLLLILCLVSFLVSFFSHEYSAGVIADKYVKCHHYEIVDIRDSDKYTIVLKNDQGGYFEVEGSLADRYELSKGDDYFLKQTIYKVEGYNISSHDHYAYTCTEGPVEDNK
jgi:hypothetical protein